MGFIETVLKTAVLGGFALVGVLMVIGLIASLFIKKDNKEADSSSSDNNRVLSWGSGDGTMEASCDDCDCLGCDETYGHGPRCS